MTERPWETEPDRLDFTADGLPCAMRRNGKYGTWCGYVGIPPEHPLFGLPTNHLLKLPASWFEGRKFDQGVGPFDLFMHMLSGAKSPEDSCPISIAFQVHGGVNYAADHPADPYNLREPTGHWWFGFDCSHAGDYLPGKIEDLKKMQEMMEEMVDSMPKGARETMRRIMAHEPVGVYRDQQYVVSECQSLAAQLIAYTKLGEKVDGSSDHRSN